MVNEKYKVTGIFPTPLVKSSNFLSEQQCSDLLELCKTLDYRDVTHSGSGINSISLELNVISKHFVDIQNSIEKTFTQFAYEVLGIEPTCDFKVSSSWATQTPSNCQGIYHFHVNSYWSGVLYFDDETSPISFNRKKDNTVFHFNTTTINAWNSPDINVDPEKGCMLLFPSNIPHRILPNQSMKTRYSIAFNLLPNGLFGTGDSTSRIQVLDL